MVKRQGTIRLQFSTVLDDELGVLVEQEAKKAGISVSALIRRILGSWAKAKHGMVPKDVIPTRSPV